MISQKLQDAINEQINLEWQSSYLYLAMSAYVGAKNFGGISSWLREQSVEEYDHGMKLYNLMEELGATIRLKAIDEPQHEFGSFKELFDMVLGHEQKVTASIHELYALAVEEKAYAAQPLLQWFVNEQVEEENTASDICHKLELIGDHSIGLLQLDSELGSRGPDSGGDE